MSSNWVWLLVTWRFQLTYVSGVASGVRILYSRFILKNVMHGNKCSVNGLFQKNVHNGVPRIHWFEFIGFPRWGGSFRSYNLGVSQCAVQLTFASTLMEHKPNLSLKKVFSYLHCRQWERVWMTLNLIPTDKTARNHDVTLKITGIKLWLVYGRILLNFVYSNTSN